MNFDFSPEQYMFQDSVRSLLAETLTPERLRAGGSCDDLWRRLAEAGVFALLACEEDGGLGLGFTDLALVFEEFGRALVPAPVAAAIIAGGIVARFATSEQRVRLLPPLAQGRSRIALAFGETSGTTPESLELTAETSADGWTVSGTKLLVPDAASADMLLVALRFGGEQAGLAVIEPGRPGVSLVEHATLDLTAKFHEVRFDRVAITAADILGGAPDREALLALFDAGATAAALQMTGMAARMLDETVAYVGQRKQFDKLIGSFQAIKHRCADMAVAVDACRSAAYYAAWALDEAGDERPRAVSMAKSWCGDQARFVGNQAIQLHGGIGFTWELSLHRFLRRIRCEEAGFGDADWHRERVIDQTLRQMVEHA